MSVLVEKKTIQKKLDEKLNELQNKVHLKGFRPGKVPTNVIKNQFGKAIYGEVIDSILKETSSKAVKSTKLSKATNVVKKEEIYLLRLFLKKRSFLLMSTRVLCHIP